MSGVDIDTSENFFAGETKLPQGLAVSPIVAAKCMQDIARTRAFIGGVNAAITDQLAKKDQVNILYAGTGPYGLLLLPLLLKFNRCPISVTLMDIHQTSIDGVKKVATALGINDCIDQILLADATQWQPYSGVEFDIIISETMKNALKKEPQLFIFAHLQQFLKHDGVLIPQKITLSAWLTNNDQERRLIMGEKVDYMPLKIGDFYVLDHSSAAELNIKGVESLNTSLIIPEFDAAYTDLKFCTDIQVYKNFNLLERQSDLTMPENFPWVSLQSHFPIVFSYVMEPYPRFVWRSEQLQASIELASFDETGDLNVPGAKRLWSKVRLDVLGELDKDLHNNEWSQDLEVMDNLGIPLEQWCPYLYTEQPSFSEFEHWLRQKIDG